MTSADSLITSPLRMENELLALEISRPSTSADNVPTTAMESEIAARVSLLR